MINLKKTMWLFVCFDLPTKTGRERARAAHFRKLLVKKGFEKFQLSIYMRHCGKSSFTDSVSRFVEGSIPPGGEVAIFRITDQQFDNIKLFCKAKEKKTTAKSSLQLKLF